MSCKRVVALYDMATVVILFVSSSFAFDLFKAWRVLYLLFFGLCFYIWIAIEYKV